MLGNDVVDLRKAKVDSNWRRNGYLAKIFSNNEQEQILRAKDPDKLVWRLWSMKEATYKIVNRQTQRRLYNPLKFSCFFNGFEGVVHFGEQIYHTKTLITGNLLHTVATQKKEYLSHIETFYLNNKVDYPSQFSLKFAPYFLDKNANGLPILTDKDGKSHVASISHHGAYLAIVCHFFL